ncbi:MAG: glycosyltransferase family 4 protein [Mariniphaga sp.]
MKPNKTDYPQNVLLIIPHLVCGGTEVQTLNLAKTLIATNYNVTIICIYSFLPIVVKEFIDNGATVICLSPEYCNPEIKVRYFRPIQLLFFLRQKINPIINKNRFDIVHVQYTAPGAIPIIYAYLAGFKKILATVHQPYTLTHGWHAKLYLRLSAFISTYFIAVSINTEISWFGKGRLYDEYIPLKMIPHHFTIYNSVDVHQIQSIQQKLIIQKEKDILGIKPGQIVIGVVSRLRLEKGIDLLIDAFNSIIKKCPNIHLLIVGSGPDESILKSKVKELNLCNNVTFYGQAFWHTAMQQLAIMDIVVVPSRFEGFGLTAAEAMAMSKPIVATDVFGLSEVVTDKETGLLFPKENVAELANCLLQLCNDPNLRHQFGCNGKIKVEKLFDISIYRKKTIHFYDQLTFPNPKS